MRIGYFAPVALVLGFAFVPAPLAAQDAEGSQDHPLISRYEGSTIAAYSHSEYDELEVPDGPTGSDLNVPSETVEGEVTRIMYEAPEGRSALEVFRNYDQALASAGFETIFECAGDECGDDFGFALYGEDTGPDELVLPPQNAENMRFLSARASDDGRSVYVTVFVGTGWFDGPMTRIDIVEAEAMEEGKVAVDPVQMYNSIEATGKAIVNDILFATSSTAIEPASAETLSAIATLLNDHPDLRIHVVGHTDATGTLQANMELSRGRAQSVVETLVSDHGIAHSRLSAAGVGPLAPVATNRSEEGRALNRRVELVDLTTK